MNNLFIGHIFINIQTHFQVFFRSYLVALFITFRSLSVCIVCSHIGNDVVRTFLTTGLRRVLWLSLLTPIWIDQIIDIHSASTDVVAVVVGKPHPLFCDAMSTCNL